MDEPVVEEDGMITSPNPDDIPAFNERMIEGFSSIVGERAKQKAG